MTCSLFMIICLNIWFQWKYIKRKKCHQFKLKTITSKYVLINQYPVHLLFCCNNDTDAVTMDTIFLKQHFIFFILTIVTKFIGFKLLYHQNISAFDNYKSIHFIDWAFATTPDMMLRPYLIQLDLFIWMLVNNCITQTLNEECSYPGGMYLQIAQPHKSSCNAWQKFWLEL